MSLTAAYVYDGAGGGNVDGAANTAAGASLSMAIGSGTLTLATADEDRNGTNNTEFGASYVMSAAGGTLSLGFTGTDGDTASKEGEAYTFMLPEDSGMVKRIEKVLGENIEKRFLEDFNYGDMKVFDSPKQLHKSNRFKRQTNFKKTSTKQSRTRNQSKNYRPPSKKQSNV